MMQIVYRILCYLILPLGVGILWIKGLSFPVIVTCTIKDFTGLDCPGCGGQRAMDALFRGEFKQAFLLNQLIYVYLAMFAYIYVLLVETYLVKNKQFKQKYGFTNWFAFAFIGLILLFFIIRNL